MAFLTSQSVFHVIGCMSGSSLDGLDLALCRFERHEQDWTFQCLKSDTVKYNAVFTERLIRVMHGSALDLALLDKDLGRFIGQHVAQLAGDRPVDLVSSHGHTVFHKPEKQLTSQIGSGAEIAAASSLMAVCDFRTVDVAMGGQGAPLVPIGESYLFPEHTAFLNLGGIANISIHDPYLVGYDVCICNQLLNTLASEQQLDYDAEGEIARSGIVNTPLLEQLNALPFHQLPPPKSLGREWFQEAVLPLIQASSASIPDKLATAIEHIAIQLAISINTFPFKTLLVTGGGAFNTYLMERINTHTSRSLETPSMEVIAYKEAITFAFLGLLRCLELPNTSAQITGAPIDTIGGCIYLPPSTTRG